MSWLVLALVSATVVEVRFAPGPPEQAAKVISLAGRVTVMEGPVPRPLKVGDAVPLRQLIATGSDSYVTFQMTDGGTFDVYSDSRVVVGNGTRNWEDILDRWLGRVRLRIQRFAGQPAPNEVWTPTAVIAVRG